MRVFTPGPLLVKGGGPFSWDAHKHATLVLFALEAGPLGLFSPTNFLLALQLGGFAALHCSINEVRSYMPCSSFSEGDELSCMAKIGARPRPRPSSTVGWKLCIRPKIWGCPYVGEDGAKKTSLSTVCNPLCPVPCLLPCLFPLLPPRRLKLAFGVDRYWDGRGSDGAPPGLGV